MSHNPNTVKSQDDLSTTNDGRRSSEVLLSTIDKIADLEEWKKDMQAKYGNKSAELEKTKKQLDIAVEGLNQYAKPRNVNMYDGDYTISVGCRYLSDNSEVAKKYLQQIEELNK